MSADSKGSGGLFFEAPDPRERSELDIGFAPDLDETPPSPDASEGPPAWLSAELPRGPVAGLGRAHPAGHTKIRYPLAEAAFARLRETPPPTPAGRADDEVDQAVPEDAHGPAGMPAAFAVGPAIMRPPTEIARPPPAADATREAGEAARADTDALLEDMVDLLLVGHDEGRHEIHLSFKEQVFGGLYVRLERRDEGLFAHFQVPDAHARRRVQGHIDDLLAHLSRGGLRICGHALHVAEEGET